MAPVDVDTRVREMRAKAHEFAERHPLEPVSRELADRIERWIAEYRGITHGEIATRLHALPIYDCWSGPILLRPTGELLYVDEFTRVPETIEWTWQRDALAVAAGHYPELRELLPVRPIDALDCPACHGTRRVLIGTHDFWCGDCYCLGWVDADDDVKPTRRRRAPKQGPYR